MLPFLYIFRACRWFKGFWTPFPVFFFFLEALKRNLAQPRRGGLLRDHMTSGMSSSSEAILNPFPASCQKSPFISIDFSLNEDSNNCHDVSFFLFHSKPKHVWLTPKKGKDFQPSKTNNEMIYGRAGMRFWKTVWRGPHVHLL